MQSINNLSKIAGINSELLKDAITATPILIQNVFKFEKTDLVVNQLESSIA